MTKSKRLTLRTDGSCCNIEGKCGFGPENCGAGNCTNNCDATANCGQYSKGGSVSCPLNVCCSAFGYCGVGPDFCESPLPEFPCQEGFGSCGTVSPPSCGGSSATQRSIGYWQSYNVRTRQCNRIMPSDINTDGLTHLYLAFATINPSSFEVVPADSADPELYKEFVALKRNGLETWLVIGGWDFSDPGSTRTTWSDLASTESSRSSFINSCVAIMEQYGFQGIDIDWYVRYESSCRAEQPTCELVAN
jgi:chitinase